MLPNCLSSPETEGCISIRYFLGGGASVERRLTTIMAADLVGYSRFMAADEEGTISRLRDARTYVIDPAIMESGGRIVKTMGDGLLVDFQSPVLAVRAALLMQRNLISRESPQGEDRRLRFRIGIHLGDVVIDGDDILLWSCQLAKEGYIYARK